MKEISLTQSLDLGDYVVFSLVMLVSFGVIFYGKWWKASKGKQDRRAELVDTILMGRKLSLPFFVATLVATWYGGIFGVTEITFNHGVYNFITQGVFWYITYLIFAFFLVSKIKRFKSLSLPDLVGDLFGPRSRVVATIFNFFNVIPVAYAISVGSLLQLIWGGSLLFNMFIGVGFVSLYCIIGGFRSVVLSDSVQFLVMCSAVLCVLIFSVVEYGGWSFLRAELPASYFDPTGGQSLANLFVWGLIALSTLVDPNFYQRVFAARSEKTAKKGILISTGVWMVFDLCTTGGALYARAVLPDAEAAQAYLLYSLQILPPLLKGFFLAGICATILSTIDSYLFVSGTTFGYDLMGKKRASRVWIRFGIILSALMSIGLAMSFEGRIESAWKTLGSYSAACLLFPVLMGMIFPRKISDLQFVCSCLAGAIVVTYWRLGVLPESLEGIPEIYPGLFATAMVLASFGLIRPYRGRSFEL